MPQDLALQSTDVDSTWDEAVAYRQPTADQVVRAQTRWLSASDKHDHHLQLQALQGQEGRRIVQEMARLEQRFQLRRALAGTAGPWRPPCAIGAAACTEIEDQLAEWTQETLLASSADTGLVLAPCLLLFQLVVASSCLFRRELGAVHRVLAHAQEALGKACPGSYLFATGPQLQARVELRLSQAALLENDFAAAVTTAQRALALLTNRQGPRDFWPPHCWEMAACHRLAALGLAGLRRQGAALEALAELGPRLGPGPTSAAEPRLAGRLCEDARTLELECRAAQHLGEGPGRPRGAEDLQALQRTAGALLAEPRTLHGRARALALAAKLSLVQELPWHDAGSARAPALQQAAESLAAAHEGLRHAELLQKVAPLEVVCAAMRGEVQEALAHGEAWAQECSVSFGEDSELAQNARHFMKELILATPGASESQPCRALQRVVLDALNCIGVGVHETLRNCREPAQPDCGKHHS